MNGSLEDLLRNFVPGKAQALAQQFESRIAREVEEGVRSHLGDVDALRAEYRGAVVEAIRRCAGKPCEEDSEPRFADAVQLAIGKTSAALFQRVRNPRPVPSSEAPKLDATATEKLLAFVFQKRGDSSSGSTPEGDGNTSDPEPAPRRHFVPRT